MKYLSMLIKPTSSACNLNCDYCFYLDIGEKRGDTNPKFMTKAEARFIIDRAFDQVEENGHIAFNFQGGEPSLMGLDFYEDFLSYAKSKEKNLTLSFTLQTNGLLLDEKWAKFLKENNFLVGLSIDGDQKTHNSYRKDKKNNKTYEKVLKTKKIFDKYKVEYNVLTVLTKELSKEPKALYGFVRDEKIKYLQIIPCLDDFGTETPYSIKPRDYYEFHKEVFNQWIKDLDEGIYISIKIFDDIVNFILYGRLGFCGMGGFCTNQNVIESDLSIYPCDFYALDSYKLGNLKDDDFDHLYQTKELLEFISKSEKTYEACKTCPLKNYCKGGCRRMKNAMYVEDKGDFCAYREIFHLVLVNIDRIKNDLRKIRSKTL
jgi:uncharacterized protein